LIHQGVELTRSLEYSVIIALVTPTGPLIAMLFADRIERKWQIVGASILVGAAGLAFAEVRNGAAVILCGALVTLGATIISLSFHAYQSELYPTRIRALAVGFVYSASRVSGIFSGFLISFTLANGGVPAVLLLVAGCMSVVVLSVGLLGPRTRGQSLEALSGDGEAVSSSVHSSPTPSSTLATAQPRQWSRS
jgi:putative MFS transporter